MYNDEGIHSSQVEESREKKTEDGVTSGHGCYAVQQGAPKGTVSQTSVSSYQLYTVVSEHLHSFADAITVHALIITYRYPLRGGILYHNRKSPPCCPISTKPVAPSPYYRHS